MDGTSADTIDIAQAPASADDAVEYSLSNGMVARLAARGRGRAAGRDSSHTIRHAAATLATAATVQPPAGTALMIS